MPLIVVPNYQLDMTDHLAMAKQRHGRRFGHPGEWVLYYLDDGFLLFDPISDVQMLAKSQEQGFMGWLALLRSYALPRTSRGWASLRATILARDKYRCVVCGASRESGAELHVDHKLPLFLGGDDHQDNLRTLCALCNLARNKNPFLGLVDQE